MRLRVVVQDTSAAILNLLWQTRCRVRHPCLTVRTASSRPKQDVTCQSAEKSPETLPLSPRIPQNSLGSQGIEGRGQM